ncbi:FemAB family XrtA/PEP-CTERM system-associated protein [Yunchengibacter salinarum]|uniref:FemAB family XrtA/PEP-CTERM system-associated protein n=1 Tax=Yunchengibacter salinarum TaxID=3133399 RepID=UPI0035B660C5
MSIRVRPMVSADRVAWDAYVAASDQAGFLHRAGWQDVVSRTTGYDTPFLLAERNGSLSGILPLALRRSVLFGRSGVSLPFCVAAGPVADDGESLRALDEEAWRRTRAIGGRALEYRGVAADQARRAGWHVDDGTSASFVGPLAGSEDARLAAIPRKQRAVVRKALKAGLRVTLGPDQLDSFYALYADSVHRLGTPVFPATLFRMLLRTFPDNVEIALVRDRHDRPVASLMSFYHGHTVMPYYAGSVAEARRLGAHDFMYFDLMNRAAERGFTRFDFGRSRVGSGPYHFKKHWGFTPQPLATAWHLAPGATPLAPDREHGLMALASRIWRHLPLTVANRLGPPLARHLG